MISMYVHAYLNAHRNCASASPPILLLEGDKGKNEHVHIITNRGCESVCDGISRVTHLNCRNISMTWWPDGDERAGAAACVVDIIINVLCASYARIPRKISGDNCAC